MVSFKNAELTGTYAVLVSNRVDWDAQRIITLYLQRWPIETFYQDGKGHLGLDEYRMRNAEAIEKHWCLVFVAYSFLHLDCLPSSPTKGSLPIKTIGEACRQQAQALMQALILYAHERLQLGQRAEEIFASFVCQATDGHGEMRLYLLLAKTQQSSNLRQNSHAPRGTTTHEKGSALCPAWVTRYNALGMAGREVVFGLVPRACDRTGPGYLPAPRTVASFLREVKHARQPLFLRVSRQPPQCREVSMDVVFPQCAGLDVHKKSITACRMVPDPTGQEAEGILELKTFGTMTRDLLALADWLTEASITHVAMESTGEYWKPVYNLLEGTFPCSW